MSARDESMTLLANYVANGFPKAKSDLPDEKFGIKRPIYIDHIVCF